MNKNIILTGSEGFLGQEFEKSLSGNNKVFSIDIKNKKKNNYFKCDITKESQVSVIVKKILKKNNIDVLINNAAYNPSSKGIAYSFSNYKFDTWKKNLEVDLLGSFLMSKYICKHFEKKNKGLIINISSIYGLVGPDQSIYQKKFKKYYGFKPIEYSVAKSGIIGFTKSLAAYYSNTNIRSICLVLGGVEKKDMSLFFKKNYKKKTILNKMAKRTDYNALLNFVISDNSSYINGSSIIIDGGATSRL